MVLQVKVEMEEDQALHTGLQDRVETEDLQALRMVLLVKEVVLEVLPVHLMVLLDLDKMETLKMVEDLAHLMALPLLKVVLEETHLVLAMELQGKMEMEEDLVLLMALQVKVETETMVDNPAHHMVHLLKTDLEEIPLALLTVLQVKVVPEMVEGLVHRMVHPAQALKEVVQVHLMEHPNKVQEEVQETASVAHLHPVMVHQEQVESLALNTVLQDLVDLEVVAVVMVMVDMVTTLMMEAMLVIFNTF